MEMREQSQKNEMAAALRGDFQRLRARGVATTLGAGSAASAAAPVLPPAPKRPARPPAAPPQSAAAPETAQEPTEAPLDPAVVTAPDAQPNVPAAVLDREPERTAEERRPSFLGRLVRRG